MPIPTKTCKCCGTELSVYHFRPNPETMLRHSFCTGCTSHLAFSQVVRWHHYYNPNFKPTRGWNPYVETESS